MSEQEHFKGRALFKGHDTRFGIFYPTNYIIDIVSAAGPVGNERRTAMQGR